MEVTQHNLEENERINIEEEKDWAKCLTFGFYSNNNVYRIFAHPLLAEQVETLTIEERSPLFCRLGCITQRCRSYLATVISANNEQLCFIYDKPFGCPFMNLMRPSFDVFDNDETSIGKIESVCELFKIKMVIKDTQDNPLYEIVTSMCHPGYFCERLCGGCCTLVFRILDMRKDGMELGKLRKTSKGFCTDL